MTDGERRGYKREDGVTVSIDNYPASGSSTAIRTVGFGPASASFNILIQVDNESGDIYVTVGNGKDGIVEILHEVLDELAAIFRNAELEETDGKT